MNSKQRRQQKRMWPYMITVCAEWEEIEEITNWLSRYVSHGFYKVKHFQEEYYFKREKDAIMFKLRWAK